MLEVCDVHVRIGEHALLSGVSFHVEKGESLGVIGPNGSGKSTLIKVISRLLVPSEGNVRLDHQLLTTYSPKMLARKMAVVSQEGLVPLPITVEEAVAMGRYPYQGFWKRDAVRDAEIVQRVLERTGLTDMACQLVSELSGGERQRVAIACALAQEPEILLLDEPTTYLDIGHQLSILNLVREWQQETGGTAVLVLHDLNLAAQYCDRLLLMENGEITRCGNIKDVMQERLLAEVYGIAPVMVNHPSLAVPQILLDRSLSS